MTVVVNGESREVPEHATVRDLLDTLELPEDGIAVAVEGQVVPRSTHREHTLCDGDRIEVIRAVGGG